MKLSNGQGLQYDIVKHNKTTKNEKVYRDFKLVDPHTDKTFWLLEMNAERLTWLGYKVVK